MNQTFKSWNENNYPHKIINGYKYWDFYEWLKIHCYLINLVSKKNKNVNLEGYVW